MPSNAGDAFIGAGLLLLGLLYGATYLTFADSGSSSNSWNSNLDKPKESHLECNDTNWSAGNAFFTIAALCFGYYAHPRGSLIVARSGRTWRLSPILALQELVLIVGLFIHAARKGKGFVVICYALLASRILNGFHPVELKEALELEMDPPPSNDNAEVYRIMGEWRDERRNASAAAPPSNLIGDEAEVYLAQWEVAKATVAQCRMQYNEHVFKGLFRYIKALDAGPSYRIFTWVPILLQLVKLVTVWLLSERVSRLTFLLAIIYFTAWLLIEAVMITASHNDLQDNDLEVAARLAHSWREFLVGVSMESGLNDNKVNSAFQVPSLFVATIGNIVLTGWLAFNNGLPR